VGLKVLYSKGRTWTDGVHEKGTKENIGMWEGKRNRILEKLLWWGASWCVFLT